MGGRFVKTFAVMALLALGLAACGTPSDEIVPTVTRIPDAPNAPVITPTPADGEEPPAATPTEAGTPAPGQTGTPAPTDGDGGAGAETVEVVSHDIYFEPDAITIPADQPVTVILPNQGAAPHNFSIDELSIDVDIAPGATEQTVIEAPAGEYEYYCNVPGHREAGMVGILTVE